jgi:hypothetical protein
LCTVVISYVALYKCGVLKRQDIENIFELMPVGSTGPVTNLLNELKDGNKKEREVYGYKDL